jgi:hypothetical protein
MMNSVEILDASNVNGNYPPFSRRDPNLDLPREKIHDHHLDSKLQKWIHRKRFVQVLDTFVLFESSFPPFVGHDLRILPEKTFLSFLPLVPPWPLVTEPRVTGNLRRGKRWTSTGIIHKWFSILYPTDREQESTPS